MQILKPAVLFLWVLVFSSAHRFANSSEKMKWLSLQEATDSLAKSQRPVLIDLYTDWCGWCKVLDEKTFSVDKVQKVLKDKTIPIKVDFDNNKKLVEQYKIKGIPCLIFVDGEGKEVGRIVGFKPADKWLDEAVKILEK